MILTFYDPVGSTKLMLPFSTRRTKGSLNLADATETCKSMNSIYMGFCGHTELATRVLTPSLQHGLQKENDVKSSKPKQSQMHLLVAL